MAKYVPPVAVLSLPGTVLSKFDPVMAFALLVGLVAGVLWRAGDARKKGETWDAIKNDLTVSCLIGLANLIIAAIIVRTLGVPPLYAIGFAMVIAAKGPDAMAWFEKRLFPPKQ